MKLWKHCRDIVDARGKRWLSARGALLWTELYGVASRCPCLTVKVRVVHTSSDSTLACHPMDIASPINGHVLLHQALDSTVHAATKQKDTSTGPTSPGHLVISSVPRTRVSTQPSTRVQRTFKLRPTVTPTLANAASFTFVGAKLFVKLSWSVRLQQLLLVSAKLEFFLS